MSQKRSQRSQAVVAASPQVNQDEQLTFKQHLLELRNRLFVVGLTLVAGVFIGYLLHKPIADFVVAPLHGEKLVYLSPAGGFDFVFKLSLYFGIVVALPIIVINIYQYLKPLMKRASKRFLAFLLISSMILAIGGICFGYFVALPSALNFLAGIAEEYATANLTTTSYLNFTIAYLLGLAALFQLPLILMIINNISGPLRPMQIFSSQKYVALGALILAAIITPTPDLYNQMLVAGPIMAIYQIGVFAVLVQNKLTASRIKQKTSRIDNIPTEVVDALADLKQERLYTPSIKPVPAEQRPAQPNSFSDVISAHSSPVQRSNPRLAQRPSQAKRVVAMDMIRPVSSAKINRPVQRLDTPKPQANLRRVVPANRPTRVYGSIDGFLA